METLQIQIPEGFKIDSFDTKTGVVKFAPKPKDIQERIKTFADVLQYHGIAPANWSTAINGVSEDEIAYRQLKLIVSALNEGWTPDWQNDDEWKYYPWFDMDSSSSSGRFSFFVSVDLFSASTVGSRLCYKSRELCDYAGTTFIDIYRRFFTI
jgi:hypothetical protein